MACKGPRVQEWDLSNPSVVKNVFEIPFPELNASCVQFDNEKVVIGARSKSFNEI
jgi:hypothetical protein